MVLSLAYRRPKLVARSQDSRQSNYSDVTDSDGSSSLKSMPVTPKGIPEALSFDRVISGGCCPPCTKREFLNFAKYIERDPENLQFFLWFKDYEGRFNALPAAEKALAPEWTEAHADAERRKYHAMVKQGQPIGGAAKQVLEGTTFDDKKATDTNAEALPFDNASQAGSSPPATGMDSIASNHTQRTAEAFEEAGMTQPFTMQPMREEISRIIAIYIIQDSPRVLNLSGRERHQVLKALEYTTHPSAFRHIINTIEYSLRTQAHPNFIRWAICNGNRPRVIFARGLGVFLILAAIVTLVLITISKVGRGWRVLPIILLILGISTLIAAWKGMCVVLHGLHHQHVRPWELFADHESQAGSEKFSGEYGSDDGKSKESLPNSSRKSFENEPWVSQYKKRNFLRKILDREVWIEEPALRQIQDTIFLQSLLGAFVISAIITAIFVAVPSPRVL